MHVSGCKVLGCVVFMALRILRQGYPINLHTHATARYCYFVNVRVIVSLTFPFSLRSQFVTVNERRERGVYFHLQNCRDTILNWTCLFMERKFRKEIQRGGGYRVDLFKCTSAATTVSSRDDVIDPRRHPSREGKRRYPLACITATQTKLCN